MKNGMWSRANWAALAACGLVMGAVAVPAIAAARNRAQQQKCAQNLHQLGIALNTYAAEYDEWLPAAAATSPTAYNFRVIGDAAPAQGNFEDNDVLAGPWEMVSSGMIRDAKVFLCAGDPFAGKGSQFRDAAKGKDFENFQSNKDMSYSVRYPWTKGADGTVKAGDWQRLTHVPQYSPVMTDMAPYMGTKAAAGEVYPATAPGVTGTVPPGEARAKDPGALVNSPNHSNEGQNLLYGDAHVEFSESPFDSNDVTEKDNLWAQRVGDAQKPIEAGSLVQALDPKAVDDAVMVPTRSTKGEMK